MTINIPEKVLSEAIEHTGTKTKREAVLIALEDFNRRRRMAALAERLHGACPNFMRRRVDRKGKSGRSRTRNRRAARRRI